MAAFDRAASDIVGRRGKQALDGVALTRAMVASARGDHKRAATFAREADVGNCPACALDVLARAYDGAGMADSARAVYERYVTLPHFERVYDGPRLAAAHERLGQLYVQQGDRGRAAAHYAQFVELWKGADPALQPRVRAAREALARLGAPS
jgi:tetratricopeptide (TPR) repeat protein